jgi:formylglycine-generating enzyme required for sulfatase activity
MKKIACILCSLVVALSFALAQEAGTNAPPVEEAGDSNPAPATAANQPGGTNDQATTEGDAAKAKPDIKELMALPEFTNSSGIIMVKISDKLWASKYEVTQKEYQKVAGGNPSQSTGDDHPVDSVSWSDAMSFCAKLTDTEREEEMLPEGMSYTLPTQAQWESFAAGVDLKDAVTGSGARRAGTSPVGSLGASGAGLHDVRGNVWEWCLDPQDKPFRVARGAGWDTFIEVNLRPEFRHYSNGPDEAKNNIGFRCVLAPAEK